ncbi:solute carrier family protein, partial [Reticulomyxa filosa]
MEKIDIEPNKSDKMDDATEASTSELDDISTTKRKCCNPDVDWLLLLRICAVGFFVNFQPSEPYLTRYLKEYKNLSDNQINNYVWPYDTYGSLISLIPIGLLAEHVGYKPVIFVGNKNKNKEFLNMWDMFAHYTYIYIH